MLDVYFRGNALGRVGREQRIEAGHVHGTLICVLRVCYYVKVKYTHVCRNMGGLLSLHGWQSGNVPGPSSKYAWRYREDIQCAIL